MSRTNSRVSQVSRNSNRNKSNSNGPGVNKVPSSENLVHNKDKQKVVPNLRILGQDREVTEDELWDLNKGKLTPTSSRSLNSSRPGSSASRATPSKQVSLQAVKRKEDRDEPVEPIDWEEFNKAVSLTESERLTLPQKSDSDSDEEVLPQRVLSPEEQQALVEQRAKDLTSALSSSRKDDEESKLTNRLTEIERERELKELQEKEREEQLKKSKLISDTEPKYRNEHYINLSARDDKNKISKSFILDNNSVAATSNNTDAILKVGKPAKRTGENVIGRHVMDRPQETAVASSAESSKEKPEAFITEVKSESNKKSEASAKSESSDDSSDEEEDLIGHKGKAPNQLLMEFVTCLMEKDYANAEKLCKMILIYEPDNAEALTFLPVIQEKQEQDAAPTEGESDEESTDSGEEEDDDEEEDSDEDDDDEDDESDDDDDEEEDDEAESSDEESDEQRPMHPDSGIASANSD